MDQEKVGKFIKKLRKDNNLSQQAFADKIGVSFQAVSKWENGKNLPDISTLKEIKKQFNVNIDEIIDGMSSKKEKRFKYIFIVFILLIVIIGLVLFILFHFKSINNSSDQFDFKEVISKNNDFKVSGNVVKTSDRTSLIINNVIYLGKDDEIEYKKLDCNLYEEKDTKANKITSCGSAQNITLKKYLQSLKIKMDHYIENCPMFTKTKMYIEIKAVNNNKTIIYKIPIEINDVTCS